MKELQDYHNYIAKKTLRLVGRRSDREDILQEVFVVLVANYHKFDRGRGTFDSWADLHILGTISQYFKKMKRKKRQVDKTLFEDVRESEKETIDTKSKNLATPYSLLAARQQYEIAQREIGGLRGSLGVIAASVILQDEDREVIQGRLGINNKCLNTALGTARGHIRNALDLACR